MNAGVLRQEQLDRALEQQRAQGAGGRRLGQLLIEMGCVTEVQLTKVLSQHLGVPWVSLQHIDFSAQLLDLVPREIAEEFCLIPVYVRHERRIGDTLYLAMDDPTHDDAIRRVMAASSMPVKSMIAAPSDIRAAIRAFYGGEAASAPVGASEPPVEAAATRSTPTRPDRPDRLATMPDPISVVRVPSIPPPTPAAATKRADPPTVQDATLADARRTPTVPDRPAKSLRPSATQTPATGTATPSRPRIVNLTLLDGTTIRLPTQPRPSVTIPDVSPPERAGDGEPPTTGELIAALRAVTNGADPRETLGDARWESLIAALLSLLLKKRLITDLEFVEEWQKM